MRDRVRNFCEEYLVNGYNATRAWMKVSPGCSQPTARVTSCNLMKRPEVREYIESRIQAVAMSTDECLARLASQARGSMSKFVAIDPLTGSARLNLVNATDDDLALISKFQEQEIPIGKTGDMKRVTTLELYSSQEALRTIAKTLGLLDDVSQAQFQKQVDALMELLRANLDTETFSKVVRVIAAGMKAPGTKNDKKKGK